MKVKKSTKVQRLENEAQSVYDTDDATAAIGLLDRESLDTILQLAKSRRVTEDGPRPTPVKVRVRAFRRLIELHEPATDLFTEAVLLDDDPHVRGWALEGLKETLPQDQLKSVLARLAKEATRPATKQALDVLLGKKLDSHALKAEHRHVRIQALKAGVTPETLKKVALNDPEVNVRSEAIDRLALVAPQDLVDVAKKETYPDLIEQCLGGLKGRDQDLLDCYWSLAKERLEGVDLSRLKAKIVKSIDSPKLLGEIVERDKGGGQARKLAAYRLTDPQEVLRLVQQKDVPGGIRALLLPHVTDQKLLAKLALTGPAQLAIPAIQGLTDPDVLKKLAGHADERVRAEVVHKITDQALLKKLATSDADDGVRWNALDRIDDPKFLGEFLLNWKDEGGGSTRLNNLIEQLAAADRRELGRLFDRCTPYIQTHLVGQLDPADWRPEYGPVLVAGVRNNIIRIENWRNDVKVDLLAKALPDIDDAAIYKRCIEALPERMRPDREAKTNFKALFEQKAPREDIQVPVPAPRQQLLRLLLRHARA